MRAGLAKASANTVETIGPRAVNGILLLDKPSGLSSNAALQRVKRLLGARKAGHTGSLDPLASGLLPICLGEATKLSHALLEADKTYRFSCRLGIQTNTGDAEGEIINTLPVPELQPDQLEQVLAGFRGESLQIPPMYSALKHQGRRLYELARKGQSVERPPRKIRIEHLELLAWNEDTIECQAHCSKGTYIRVLAEDIASALGCCGHLSALRRVAVAPFEATAMVTLAQLEVSAHQHDTAWRQHLLPADAALADWPRVMLDASRAQKIIAGQAVVLGRPRPAGKVSLYGPGQRFIGIGEVLPDNRLVLRRLIRPD